MIDMYQSHQKRHKMALNELFDITDNNGMWLNKEDKNLYSIQTASSGKVGYSSQKLAPITSIHPSKRAKLPDSDAIAHIPVLISDDSSSVENLQENIFNVSDSPKSERKRKANTKIAAKVAAQTMTSARKTSRILSVLKKEGCSVPDATQSAINKRLLRNSACAKTNLKDKLRKGDHFCLHFDGKRCAKNSKERIVVCLSNETENLYLGVLTLTDSSAESISNSLINLIDSYDAWKNIKVIITDTTNVNTGKNNGIVVRLQRTFTLKGFVSPQYIGCQLHILDRILRIIMDEVFLVSQHSPNIEYDFVKEIAKNYKQLKSDYTFDSETCFIVKDKWNNDMDHFEELVRAFQYFLKEHRLPRIKFRSLPNLSQARWNSRGIYCLLAFFLLEERRPILQPVCIFIAGNWSKVWFSNHKYNDKVYSLLESDLKNYGCNKALKCLDTHFSKDETRLPISRTNRVACA